MCIRDRYKRCKRGVFIGTSPDEKLFDAVKPNMDSFVTQMVDYFVEKGHKRCLLYTSPVTPEALYYGIRFLTERYHLPLYITENGMSDLDNISADGQVHPKM